MQNNRVWAGNIHSPIKLAEKLQKFGINIIGTSFDSLDLAEDRGRFSTLLKDQGIPYPEFGVATDPDEALEVSKQIGFPLLVPRKFG